MKPQFRKIYFHLLYDPNKSQWLVVKKNGEAGVYYKDNFVPCRNFAPWFSDVAGLIKKFANRLEKNEI